MTTPTDPVQMALDMLDHYIPENEPGMHHAYITGTEAKTIRTALRARTEWRPIAEAPRDGTEILLANARTIAVGKWSEFWPGWEIFNDRVFRAPTHWQPLPPPPTDAGV